MLSVTRLSPWNFPSLTARLLNLQAYNYKLRQNDVHTLHSRLLLGCTTGNKYISQQHNVASVPATHKSSCATWKCQTQSVRLISTSGEKWLPFWRFTPKDEPSKDQLIYSGPQTALVRYIKFFSLSTSIISAGIIPLLYMSADKGVLTVIGGSMAMIMVCTPLILHWFTKTYVAKMYYDHSTKTYTAHTYDFVVSDVKTEFKQFEVSVPDVSNVMTSFTIRGKPVLVDPRGFMNPNHFSHLMGYTDTKGNVSVEEAKRAFKESSDSSQT